MIGKWLGGLFGGAQERVAEPERYKEFAIRVEPLPRDGQWLTAGSIEREIDGELHSRKFIRADLHASREQAEAHALVKARQIIDERKGELFDGDDPL